MDASMLLVLVGSPKIQSRARTRHQRLLCQMHPAAITQRSSDLSAETPLLRMVYVTKAVKQGPPVELEFCTPGTA